VNIAMTIGSAHYGDPPPLISLWGSFVVSTLLGWASCKAFTSAGIGGEVKQS
jgi:hypothetical protein